MPLRADDEVVVGMIFYYTDHIDLSNYKVEYYNYAPFNQGPFFWLMCIMILCWFFSLGIFFVARQIYKKADREFELRKSGIACMAELYDVVYIVDLVRDKLIPVTVDAEGDKLRPKDASAQAQFRHLFEIDSEDEYRDAMNEFANLDTIRERLKTRNSIATEYRGGKFGWARVQFIVMDREEGKPVERLLFTFQEINEEKRELDEMMSQIQAAKSESSAKSAFLANMSHEIRTPINTVLGLDTMILRESNDKQIIRYARDIKTAGNMLLALINSILDFSKMEAGKMELVNGEYSLKGMVSDIRTLIVGRADGKSLSFDIDVSPELPDRLYGDEVRLKQVIINLLTNAIKYTEEGGIRLAIFGKQTDEKTVHLLVSVKDTGSGISRENQDRMFDRYSRFDEEKNHKVEGTGIGLNLVEGLLELMGSELKLASVYGSGSDFYFELDQRVVAPAPIGKVDWNEDATSDESYRVTFTAPNARVLVVDDNSMNRVVFNNLLKETRIGIDEASGGEEALELTADNKYDLIFMDHMMPGMDGVETFNKIRAQEGGLNRETPVIALTANALQGAREEYTGYGFVDFLAKPIDSVSLEEKIFDILPEELIDKKPIEHAPASVGDDVDDDELPIANSIDLTYGIEHSGGKESLVNIMKQFVAVGRSDAEELSGYADVLRDNPSDEATLSSYRIKVHSMKTSAGLCGALQVSGGAALLELVAQRGDGKSLADMTPHFLETWNELWQILHDHFRGDEPDETNGEVIDEEVLHSLLGQLVTSMKSYDVKSADAVISQIDAYSLPAGTKDSFEKLKTAVANLDAEACENICKEIMG
ncbi:MAG: response regulator, partial [Eubacterium sp.]|nr:response regulator [Eubacterium sp.]